jgi:hypothetical protein
VDFLYA